MLLKLNLAPVINGFSVVDFIKKLMVSSKYCICSFLYAMHCYHFLSVFCIRTCDVSVYLFEVKTFEKDFVALGISYYATYYVYIQYAS